MAKIQINENDIKQMVYKSVVKVLNENNFKNYIKRRNAAIHTIGKKRGLSDDEIRQNMYDAMAKDQALKDINKGQLIRAQSKHEQKFKNPITNDTFNIDFDELNYYDPVYDNFSKNNKPMEGSDEEWWRGPNADDYLRESKIKQIVSESVKRVLKESNLDFAPDSWYDEDEGESMMPFPLTQEGEYKWFIHVNDKRIESDRVFNSVDEAERDCNKYLGKIHFHFLAKKLNDDTNPERVAATIESMSDGIPHDTMLQNYGWGWMD